MIEVRLATPDDAPEVVRLRGLMFAAMFGAEPEGWQAECEAALRRRIGRDPALAVYVIDGPDRRLAACAIGGVEQRLPGPGNPSGRVGYLSNVCTDPASRRRGYSRRLVDAVMSWFDQQDCRRVELHATAEGAGLYRSLGFTEPSFPAMTWLARPEPPAQPPVRAADGARSATQTGLAPRL